jgi:hypothetical protein
MNLRDADTGSVLWEAKWYSALFFLINNIPKGNPMKYFQTSKQVTNRKKLTLTISANIPKQILKCRTVSREISFSSKELINNFRLTQKVLLLDKCIEGTFLSNSTNLFRMEICLWICHSKLHQQLANNYRSRSRH